MPSALAILKAASQELRRLLDNPNASQASIDKAAKRLAKAQKNPNLRRKP